MGQWLITVSAASMAVAVLNNLAGDGKIAKTAYFATGLVYLAVVLNATIQLFGG